MMDSVWFSVPGVQTHIWPKAQQHKGQGNQFIAAWCRAIKEQLSLREDNRLGVGKQKVKGSCIQCAKGWESLGKAWCHLQPMPGWCFVFLQVFGVSCRRKIPS